MGVVGFAFVGCRCEYRGGCVTTGIVGDFRRSRTNTGHNGTMRYLVALIIGIGALFGVNAFADLFSMPRPWNSLLMGATVGITMVVVLLIWEVVKPSNKDAAPAKPAMSEEERANARAERRSRLAAEAGVSTDDTDDAAGTDQARSTSRNSAGDVDSTGDAVDSTGDGADSGRDDEPSDSAPDSTTEDTGAEANDEGVPSDSHRPPDSDESSIEAEPNDDTVQQQPKDGDTVQAEPATLAPDEFDEEATGSSLENPPTGEPGVSVDALEDAEEAGTDDAADDGHVDSEPTTHEPDSKR